MEQMDQDSQCNSIAENLMGGGRAGGGGMEWNGICCLSLSPLLLDGGHSLDVQETSLSLGIEST